MTERVVDRRQFLLGLGVAGLGLVAACAPEPKPAPTPESLATPVPVAVSEVVTPAVVPDTLRLPMDLPYTEEERNYYLSHAKIINSILKKTFTDSVFKGIVNPDLVIIDRFVNDWIKYDPNLGDVMTYEYDMYLYLGIGRNTIHYKPGASWLPESIYYPFWHVDIKMNDPELIKIYGDEANFFLGIEAWYQDPIQKDINGNKVRMYKWHLDHHAFHPEESNPRLISDALLPNVASRIVRIPENSNWEKVSRDINNEELETPFMIFQSRDADSQIKTEGSIRTNGSVTYFVDFSGQKN